MTRRPAARCAALPAGLLALGGLGILGACGSTTPPLDVASAGASSAAPGAATTGPPGSASPADSRPPFVATATWVLGSGGRSLHVRPTDAGRAAHGAGGAAEAWREVLRLAPDADQPGMQAQLDCHWTYARLARPDKPTWNLEPWRPVVSAQELVDDACNPGGPESADG